MIDTGRVRCRSGFVCFVLLLPLSILQFLHCFRSPIFVVAHRPWGTEANGAGPDDTESGNVADGKYICPVLHAGLKMSYLFDGTFSALETLVHAWFMRCKLSETAPLARPVLTLRPSTRRCPVARPLLSLSRGGLILRFY
jgi:hypothetical protein